MRLARVAVPAILLGADVPGLTASHLISAAKVLETGDVVIGPATDGGYYLLGCKAPFPFLFNDMPWGTSSVLELTKNRLAEYGITPTLLDPLADCDRPEDLGLWPELARELLA
jgi:uncharacterized protein